MPSSASSRSVACRAPGSSGQPRGELGRQRVEGAGVDVDRGLRRLGRLGERLQQPADGQRLGVGQVECAAVEIGHVGEVVHRLGHEVDGHDVDLAALDADAAHPGRQDAAEPLDGLEEVVRPVDLVDLAGLRVADDDAGPVDPPRHGALLPHDRLGVVLRAVVGVVVEVGGLVEHVLAEHALVEPGDGDRADVVEVPGPDRLGQLQRVPGPLDVGQVLAVGVGGEVVDGRDVEEVLDLAAEAFDLVGFDAQSVAGEVADHRDDPVVLVVEPRLQIIDAVQRAGATQAVDLPLPVREEFGEQESPDEAGRTGDEVGHHRILAHRRRRGQSAGLSRPARSGKWRRRPARG